MYKIVDPDYVSLNYLYENEEQQARKNHRLPLSQWVPECDLRMQLTSQLGL